MKFMDTMSMHIAIAGFTSFQRVLYNANKKGKVVTSPKALKQRFRKQPANDQENLDVS